MDEAKIKTHRVDSAVVALVLAHTASPKSMRLKKQPAVASDALARVEQRKLEHNRSAGHALRLAGARSARG